LLKIAIPMVDAVVAAHQKGITHRDLKPANIMIGSSEHEGRVKVLDLGLAKLAGTSPSDGATTVLATGEGRILGTVAYMSPEQAEGKSIDGRSDLFSLGVILYEMATGARPFTGDTSISIISSIVNDTPVSLTEVDPATPRDLARIVRRALAKDPEERYQTAKDLRNDLEELKASLDSGESTAESAPGGAAPPAGNSHNGRWVAIAAAVVAISALATLAVTRRGTPSTPTVAQVSPIRMTALTSTGDAGVAQLSPDGNYLAYVQFDHGQTSVWVRQLASGSTVRIVAPVSGAAVWGLAITPDSSFVDFVRSRSAASLQPMDLWRVPLLGGQPRKVVDDVASPPGWSPDGKEMAYFTAPAREYRLMVARADGSEPRVVASRTIPRPYVTLPFASRPDTRPVWFPDGRAIAVMGLDEQRGLLSPYQVIRIDVATGVETELLTTSFSSGGGMVLGRDAQSVTINIAESGPSQVVTISLRNGFKTSLTNDLATYAGVGAAGDAIVATRRQTNTGLWVLDAAGRNPRQIGRDLPAVLSGLSWIGKHAPCVWRDAGWRPGHLVHRCRRHARSRRGSRKLPFHECGRANDGLLPSCRRRDLAC
jgi:Tol biopolymer transport system component